MANRTKEPKDKNTAALFIRCSPSFKKQVETRFQEGVSDPAGKKHESVSDWVRSLLETDMKR